jgi:retron-type reverse transcriptase
VLDADIANCFNNINHTADVSQDTFRISLRKRLLDTFSVPACFP